MAATPLSLGSPGTLQLVAEVTKYVALTVGAASTVLSLSFDFHKKVRGRRRLTLPGKAALGIAVVGFALSIGSSAVEDKLKKAADDKARSESDERVKERADDLAGRQVAEEKRAADRAHDLKVQQDAQAKIFEGQLATLAATGRLRAEQADYSQRALLQIWRAATKVDLSKIEVEVEPNCQVGPDRTLILDGAELSVTISKKMNSEGPEQDHITMRSTTQTRLKSRWSSGYIVAFTNFGTNSNLSHFKDIDQWRHTSVSFRIIGSDGLSINHLRNLFPGEVEETKFTDGPSKVEFVDCPYFSFNMTMDGVNIGGGSGRAGLISSVNPDEYLTLFTTDYKPIRDDLLPQFPEQPASRPADSPSRPDNTRQVKPGPATRIANRHGRNAKTLTPPPIALQAAPLQEPF